VRLALDDVAGGFLRFTETVLSTAGLFAFLGLAVAGPAGAISNT
jgi:hypothetical protein